MLKGDKPIHENHLACMGKELTHRGPDNFSFVIRERAGFAHTRLSIIDVSEAGNQPFQNSRYVLCYNGEIYNYLDLK
ncbi:MAG: asparagine synthetase B, partial [Candidatus Aenigmarchaeota archaeon]|nr:asparagine synthetase B [Candidatus Aenigmarchaeota archaeon]